MNQRYSEGYELKGLLNERQWSRLNQVFAFGQTDFITECDFCFQVANLKDEYSDNKVCGFLMCP